MRCWVPAEGWLFSGDRNADRAAVERFVARYRAKHAIVVDGDRATLTIGEDDFPFAFPLVRSGALWRFDTEAGKEELLARRIGENELSAIKVLQAIADAQREYATVDRNRNGILEYATRIDSSPGKKDGLFWRVKDGEAPSPLGPLLARASAEGYTKDKQAPTPYHGYYFRLLPGQAASAKSGALDYTIRGRTIGGFAAVAYPANYGNTGHHVVPDQPGWHGLREGPRPRHAGGRPEDAALRSRTRLVAGVGHAVIP